MELEDSELDCGECRHFAHSPETHKFHCSQHEIAVRYKTDIKPCEWYEEDDLPEYLGCEEMEE